MSSKTCVWVNTGYNYDTECGHTHFAYARPSFQPDIKRDELDNDICPYCRGFISYEEEDE